MRPDRGYLAALLGLAAAVCARAEEIGPFTCTAPAAVAQDCAREGGRLQRNPACVFGRKVYLVAWTDGSRQPVKCAADIYCARIEAKTGRCLDPKGIAVCKADGLQDYPAVAFDGRNFLVVWQDLRNGKDYDVYAARVTEDGKVLDAETFPVCALPGANQARPAVAFASGNHLVAWMDSRAYPVYSLYFARVSPAGRCLDPQGRFLDGEGADRLKNVPKPGTRWPAKMKYWWDGFGSRSSPRAASNGREVFVAYIFESHFAEGSNPKAAGAVVNPASGKVTVKPTQFAGKGSGARTTPHDRPWPCVTDKGWAVAFDHWVSGWTSRPELAVMRLDAALGTTDRCQTSSENASAVPRAEVTKEFGGGYNYGKGMDAFWQAAAAWNGRHVVVVMAYASRKEKVPPEQRFRFVIAANRADAAGEPKLLDERCAVLASGSNGVVVNHPALAAGPDGEGLLVYELDEGVDRLRVMSRIVREK